MSIEFQIVANNPKAPFTLKLHRGDGMALLAMNWKGGGPPADFEHGGFHLTSRNPDTHEVHLIATGDGGAVTFSTTAVTVEADGSRSLLDTGGELLLVPQKGAPSVELRAVVRGAGSASEGARSRLRPSSVDAQ